MWEQQRAYRQKNRERYRTYCREYRRKNIFHIRQKENAWRHKLQKEVLNHYSNGTMGCVCCRQTESRFLSIDHINGRTKEDNLIGHRLYCYLKRNNFPSGYQVLCFNCNLAKAREPTNICPHKESTSRNLNKLHVEVLTKYSIDKMKCACCGETEYKFLSLDHIDPKTKQKHDKTTGDKLYLWIKRNNFPPFFQVLCYNCNLSKGFFGACPHTQNDMRNA